MTTPEELRRLELLLQFKPTFDRLCQEAEDVLLAVTAADDYELAHHKVTRTRSSRLWAVDDDQVKEAFGDDALAPAPVRSVAQMEKAVGKGNVPQEMVLVKQGRLKLVPASQPAEEITFAREFDKLCE